jgi:hypothetical protein
MKYILSILLLSIVSFGQIPNFPTVSPSVVNVTFDLAKDTIVSAPEVFISSNNSTFAYNVVVPNNNPAILVWPVQGFIPPGTTTAVRISVIASNLTVGNYNIPVTFVQNSPSTSVSVGLNLTVIDSRTFTTSLDPTVSHIASGGGWKTTVKLTNTSPNVSLVTLKFYDPQGVNVPFAVNGSYTSEYSVAIPGYGSSDVILLDPTTLKTGSLDIKTVYGSGVVAQATYANSLFEGTIPASIPNRDSFSLSFDNIDRTSTGIALVNYLNYAQDVNFVFYDTMGTQLHTGVVSLPAKGQTAITLDTTFPITKGKSGTLKVNTQRPGLTGFGLKFNLDKGYFTTIPIM